VNTSLIGIQKSSLQLVEMSGAVKGKVAGNRRLAWETSMGLKGCKWVFSNRGYGAKRTRGVIGLRVLSPVAETMIKEGSYGFRYAMYILAIGYCGSI
jgi:hypothetical protein